MSIDNTFLCSRPPTKYILKLLYAVILLNWLKNYAMLNKLLQFVSNKSIFCFLFLLSSFLGHAQLVGYDDGTGRLNGAISGYTYTIYAQLGDVDCSDDDEYVHNLYFNINGERIFEITKSAGQYSRYIGNQSNAGCADGGSTFDWYLNAPSQEILNAISSSVTGWGSDEVMGQFTYTLPSRFLKSGLLNIDAASNSTEGYFTWITSPTAPKLATQPDLRVASSCNSVKLSWDKLNIAFPFSLSEYKYKIYKDNAYLITLDGDATEYKALNVDKESEFKVQLLWNNEEIEYKSQTGAPYDPLAIPADLQATTDRCDGKIDLKWQWSQASPTYFVIYKSTSSNGPFTIHEQIVGTKRTYSALNLTAGTKYYFKIAAKGGKCPEEGLQSDEAVVGLIPMDPVAPSNALMEMQSVTDSGVKVSWNETQWTADYFANPSNETYKIIRKDLKKGTETTIEIPIGDFYQAQIQNQARNSSGTGYRLFYIDREITTCESYSYKITANTKCKSSVASSCLAPDTTDKLSITNITLSEIFKGNNLQTSKGYYPEIVELNWSVNDYETFVNQFKIYRRTLGSTVLPELVTSLDGYSRSWEDTKAIPKTLYEYFVIAEANCGLENLKSYPIASTQGMQYSQLTGLHGIATGIGFRIPVATVTGNISYVGGFAVPNVKVVAERDGQTTGNSLYLDGTNQYVKINPKGIINYNATGFSTSAWIKPEVLTGTKTIAKQNGVFEIQLNNTKAKVIIGTNTIESNSDLEIGKYANITATCSADSLHLYINGKKDKSLRRTNLAGLTTSSNALVYLGSSQGTAPFFKGNIDEFRLFKSTLTPYEVARDYSRVIPGESSNLVGYWRFDEGVGPMIFDSSKDSGVFHKNDGELFGASWSTQVPAKEQLGYAGFTDNNGNYIIEGILYNGTGENFRITPTMTLSGAVHEFTPSQRILFLGNGRSTENNQDFIDKSSFNVTGIVLYDFANNLSDLNTKTSGSPGVSIWLDGTQQLLRNNQPIVTNASGQFEITVPIGKHFLEFRKEGHTFVHNKFPSETNTNNGVYDFQDILSGIKIMDATKHTLVGCVVGGLVQGNKKLGFKNDKGNLKPGVQRINNIGKAKFKLTSIDIAQIEREVETDPETGDFQIELPPNEYSFSDVALVGDPNDPNDDRIVKFRADLQSVKLADTDAYKGISVEEFVKANGVFANKKVTYNAAKRIIIRNEPNITVKDDKGQNFLPNYTVNLSSQKTEVGENTIKFYDKVAKVEVKIPTSGLKYPLFTQGKQYKTIIQATEKYEYFGVKPAANPAKDEVPVLDGVLTINNNISASEAGGDVASYQKSDGTLELVSGNTHQMNLQNAGAVNYTFMAGDPNLIQDSNITDNSFTKSLSISLVADGKIIYWPETSNAAISYKSYVMGAKKMPGTDFVTVAPVEIQSAIRIPPGTNSSVTIEKGSTYAIENSNSTTAGGDWNSGLGLAFSYEAEVPITGTKLANTEGQVMVSSYGSKILGSEKNTTTTNSFAENFTILSQDSFNKGDFFISTSSNIEIGRASEIKFIPSTLCENCQGPIARGDDGKNYILNIGNSFYQKELGKTFSLYSENHIKTDIIPKLELLRNSLFTSQPTIYRITAGVSPNNPLFATNNDDPRWPNNATSINDYTKDDPADDSGVSYTFNRAIAPVVNGIIQDKVRWYNNQIRAWQEILMNNEIDKWIATKEPSANSRNISISSGIAYTNSSTVAKEEVIVRSSEIMAGSSIDAEAKFLVGAGFLVGPTISIHSGLNATTTTSNTNSNQKAVTTSYSIQDNDPYNIYNLNVHKGTGNNGPVFQVIAGQTSCPFEREKELEVTKNHIYYLNYWIRNLPLIKEDKKTNITLVANEEILAIDKEIRTLTCIQGTDDYETCNTLKSYLLSKKTQVLADKNASILRIESLLDAKKSYFEELYALFTANAKPLLGARTVQIEKPSILVNGNDKATRLNVPSTKAAIFDLELRNETELIPSSPSDQVSYQLSVDPSSNPDGLVVLLNGENLVRPVSISIPFGQKVRQTLTVFRGPNEYKYTDLKLIFESACDTTIHKEIKMDIEYIPVCAEAVIASPGNKWTVNYDSKNKLGVKVNGYDVNYEGFKYINIQYKRSSASESDWKLLETYYRDATARTLAGPDEVSRNAPLLNEQRGNEFIYNWNVTNLPDDLYDIRLQSVCRGDNADVIFTSPTISGIIDRVNPHTFGLPQPADGVLEAGDEILLQFNEPINAGLLGPTNFDIRGVVQGGELKHPASIYFNGTSDYMEIPEGILLNRRSFSIDFYAKRKRSGVETIISQGSSTTQSFIVGFNASNQLEVVLAGKKITSENAIPVNNTWAHFAFVYDAAESKAFIYHNGVLKGTVANFTPNYEAVGKILVAKNLLVPNSYFKGNIHELRFWGKALSVGQVNVAATKRLNSNEPSLLGNWRMEESEGIEVVDLVRERNAEIKSGTWEVDLVGNALKTSSSSNVTIKSPAYEDVSNFTAEFWFKGDRTTNATLLSNGRGDNLDPNQNGWSFRVNSSGIIEVWNNNKLFKATEKNYFDNQWHHFALVVNHSLNTVCFIDGNQQNSVETSGVGFSGFGGASLHLGALGWIASDSSVHREQAFEGALDEIRIWQGTRSVLQIKRDMRYMLSGDEAGLDLYLPFDAYVNNMGIEMLEPSNKSSASATTAVRENGNPALIVGTPAYVQETPLIKLPRPVRKINFTYSANQDKIILTTSDPDYTIENVLLDISVQNVKDLNGNSMKETVRWTAFVDKNQVVWTDNYKKVEIESGKGFTFNTTIKNTGGKIFNFNIKNLPSWLTVSPSSGIINPVSSLPITFTIDKNVNIGNYVQDILLETEFGFDEVFNLNLDVIKPLPEDWKVNPSDFELSMNFVAQLRINGEISRDSNDQVAAFVGDQCRGIAKLKYNPILDNYIAFISVYSNSENEPIQFRIWNASDGQVHRDVTPTYFFESNEVKGTLLQPEILNAVDVLEYTYNLAKGWTWISSHLNFNYNPNKQLKTKDLLKPIKSVNGDLIRDIDSFDSFDADEGWIGTLTSKGGIKNGKGYKIYLNSSSQLKYSGLLLKGEQVKVDLVKGWNWIGYIGFKNMPINQALAGFSDVSNGDIIKNQYTMAQYSPSVGWIGDLTYLEPGVGYMMRTAKTGNFYYPNLNYSASTSKFTSAATYASINSTTKTSKIESSYQYATNMNLIAEVANEALTPEDTLRAFVGKELRGESYPVWNPLTNKQSYFMTIYGQNTDEVIRFEWFNASTNKKVALNENFTFKSDIVLGSTVTPQLLTIVEPTEVNESILVYPNPFVNYMILKLYPMHKAIKATVFDMLGHALQNIDIKSTQNEIRLEMINYPKGTYIISLFDESGTNIYTQQLLK